MVCILSVDDNSSLLRLSRTSCQSRNSPDGLSVDLCGDSSSESHDYSSDSQRSSSKSHRSSIESSISSVEICALAAGRNTASQRSSIASFSSRNPYLSRDGTKIIDASAGAPPPPRTTPGLILHSHPRNDACLPHLWHQTQKLESRMLVISTPDPFGMAVQSFSLSEFSCSNYAPL